MNLPANAINGTAHPSYRRTLVIDNYDSFTYNLVDYLRQLGTAVTVYRNTIAPDAIDPASFDLLVLSPGPSVPKNAGNLMQIIAQFHNTKPMLGICLGHQALVEFFGGSIHKVAPRHGKAEQVVHDGLTLFDGLPPNVEVARYHSWAAQHVPDIMTVSARAADGTVMGIRHKLLPVEGLQFHPESILSLRQDAGMRILRNAIEGKLANGFKDYKALMAELQDAPALTEATLQHFIQSIGRGHLNEDQRLVLLVALAFRLRQPQAMAAFVQALLQYGKVHAHDFESMNAVDICGTGGSGLPRLNTSTLVALCLAANGLPIAKHGNRAASGRFGSFDLIEALGLPLKLSQAQIGQALAQTNLAFLFAAHLHPVVGHFAGSRARVGIPTVFNVLGPLLNPLQPARQMIGTAFAQYMELILETGILLGRQELYVLRADDGLDDVSASGPTHVLAYRNGKREKFTVRPEDFGLAALPLQEVLVHGPQEGVARAQQIIDGRLETGHYKLVAVNAAFAYAQFTGTPLPDAYAKMEATLRSGALRTVLEQYRAVTATQPAFQTA
jgi:anthranilate synthase/phosphoribosyltransferase